jgi:hypothetical protein
MVLSDSPFSRRGDKGKRGWNQSRAKGISPPPAWLLPTRQLVSLLTTLLDLAKSDLVTIAPDACAPADDLIGGQFSAPTSVDREQPRQSCPTYYRVKHKRARFLLAKARLAGHA